MSLNDNAQPRNRAFSAARLNDRRIDELIGVCKGVLADGIVVQEEAHFLQEWLETNREIADHWPANVLYQRICEALADGALDLNEERELLEVLLEVTGGPSIRENVASMSSALPLTKPEPEVIFEQRKFCFTGKFVTGPRRECEIIVLEKSGAVSKTPTKDTHYLVIGLIGSSDWIHSTHGRKIEKAVNMREEGHNICIISEELWVKHID